MAKRPEGRYWTFTVNNPTEIYDEKFQLKGEFVWDAPWPYWDIVSYVHWSYEVGEQGTPHIQGYLETKRKQRMTALKKLKGLERAHFEMRRGTQEQAIAYCEKPLHPDLFTEDDIATHLAGPYSYGQRAENADRGKYERVTPLAIYEMTRAGASDRELWDAHPGLMMTHHSKPRIIREVYQIFNKGHRSEAPIVFLFIGVPRTGKTTIVKTITDEIGSVYHVPYPATGTLWFDPEYQQQDCVVFDDFDGRYMTPMMFKKLIDQAPTKVPVKGRHGADFNSPYVFITSNYHPRYWWKKIQKNDYVAIMERITFKFFVRTGRSSLIEQAVSANPVGFSANLVLPDLAPPAADPPLPIPKNLKTTHKRKKIFD